MSLSKEAVEDFLAAKKVVPKPRDAIRWRVVTADLVRWRGVVEVGGVGRGSLWLYVNKALPRTWNLALYWR